MSTIKDKTLDDLRTEVGDHLDTARAELMAAAKAADRLSMKRTHQHCMAAVSHVDDALALLSESGE